MTGWAASERIHSEKRKALPFSILCDALPIVSNAAFAGVALLLASIGLYGVMAYSVAQRTREIGIRMALGANRIDVLKLVLGHALFLVSIGIGLGLLVAIVLSQTIKTLLFGVSAADPITYVGTSVVLALVALVASYIPARRATKVDAQTALRAD